ncbi:hypothetical protein Tco_1097475 [Tanacetum coccineum]
MDGTPVEINMLVEKNYPLIKELLEKMLNLQLEAKEESTMAFELIKFIKSLLEELNLLLPVLVYAARHSLTTVRHKLMMPCITSYCWFWTSAKVKTVNREQQIQALVDKKKVIISETSIRTDHKLDDAEGTNCLPTAIIFAELERMGYENLTQKLTFYKAYFSSQWKFLIHTILQYLSAKTTSWNEFSSTMASAIIWFFGRVTPLFSIMMVQAIEDMGADSATPTDSHSIPIIT